MKRSIYIVILFIISMFSLVSSCEKKRSRNDITRVECEIESLVPYDTILKEFKLTLISKKSPAQTLSLLVGDNEAQVLAINIEKMKPKMPLPLDLLDETLKQLDYKIQEVIIDSVVDDIYISKIVCVSGNKSFSLTARVADAIALAAKTKCPIYISRYLFKGQ